MMLPIFYYSDVILCDLLADPKQGKEAKGNKRNRSKLINKKKSE